MKNSAGSECGHHSDARGGGRENQMWLIKGDCPAPLFESPPGLPLSNWEYVGIICSDSHFNKNECNYQSSHFGSTWCK